VADKQIIRFAKEKCQNNIYSVGDHNFHPHWDAPNHQNPQYKDRGFDLMIKR